MSETLRNDEIPDLAWVRRELDAASRPFYRGKVLDAFVIGSYARGTAKKDSDLDIAVIVPERSRKSSLKLSEDFHSQYTSENYKPRFSGRIVDFQFFYPDDAELATYNKLRKGAPKQ